MQNFWALGAPPPDPQNSLPYPLRISGYAPVTKTSSLPIRFFSLFEKYNVKAKS